MLKTKLEKAEAKSHALRRLLTEVEEENGEVWGDRLEDLLRLAWHEASERMQAAEIAELS